MSERAVGIIPARIGSSRFPGKVLACETGRPLIRHVYEAAARSASLSRVVVATDDARVVEAVRAFGGDVVLTRSDHVNGSSRLAEAAAVLGLDAAALVVNVQGDEPEVEAGTIDAAVEALLRGEGAEGAAGSRRTVMGTAAAVIQTDEDATDPNVVKVLRALDGSALCFTRARVPWDREQRGGPDCVCLRHVGLYVYRRRFLERYLVMESTPLERAEQLEQMRVLEHGYAIAVALVARAHAGIDTPEQYRAFVERWRAGELGQAGRPSH